MESFAEKIISGKRFDPMMEEGGRIQGPAHKQDEEMAKVVIEALAEVNKPTTEGGFNPFQTQKSEILPEEM